MTGNLDAKKAAKMRPPMRSSIACTRCRKSKIKCENNGGTSPCDSCIKTGKDCIFTLPDPIAPKRTVPPANVKQERDGGSDRKKLKKIDDISKVDNQRASVYAEEVLSAPFLTEDMWEQILDLYKLHFAPELPFLHLPTLREELGRKFRSPPSESGSDYNLVLLGILTLTARFHPDLVKYLAHICNNQPGNARSRPIQMPFDPAAASEYYADILAMALGPLRTAMSIASVQRVAAFLMLGLYEWSQTRPKTGGMTAWMYIGAAIRMAQFLGLGFVDAHDSMGSGSQAPRNSCHQSQIALQKETKRRIMFSCFILDRMLACGKERISIIQPGDLQIQLPCSEDKFDLAMEVQTGFLNEGPRRGSDDSVLGRLIQLVNIWGDISRFSSQGGRFAEKRDPGNENTTYPPWNENTTFYRLNKRLEAFDLDLPDTFTFSRSNYFKHENHQASSAYVLLHMLRCVCLIMLHREYIPFVPVRCREPEGPLDRPVFHKDECPEGWWKASAEHVFKAARDIVDLIEICQRKDKLPQSTIVLFAIWTAAFVGLYAHHFPQMDTERHMLSYDFEDTRPDEPKPDVFRRGATASTFQTLHKMSTWLKMATTYVEILLQMDKYFERIVQDYYKYAELNARSNTVTDRVREGGTGGAAEEYHPLTPYLKDLGPLRPVENHHIDSSGPPRTSIMDRAGSVGAESYASTLNRSATSTPAASFKAINHTPIAPAPEMNGSHPRTPVSQGPHGEMYTDSWRHHSAGHQPQQLPSKAFPTSSSMLDPASIAAQAHERSIMQDESEGFWISFKKEEPRRFGTTGDLGLFSSGESQLSVSDMPFEDSAYIPAMDEASFQFLQQASGY